VAINGNESKEVSFFVANLFFLFTSWTDIGRDAVSKPFFLYLIMAHGNWQ